ncbi:MAG: tRNA 2-thiocytidine biosynthesis protein TtcA [Defluviitaleaceae bacterium]|nr:tRNA 2-thiocytidine biosynthesis protein TtcA [Defluviitaleaceae bacterium]
MDVNLPTQYRSKATDNIEHSILKKFRRTIWRPFIEGIKRYALLQPGDKIAVCVSGGKDSMLLAKLMQLLHSRSDFPFGLKFITMDPGFTPAARGEIEANAQALDIPLRFFNTNVFDTVSKAERCPCYLCARMRRGHLYAQARESGCNKIATGHHFSDVVETVLMNVFHGGTFETMMPKLRSRNYPGMELIRPLYCVHEDAILAWVKHNGLTFGNCACPLAEKNAQTETVGRRQSVKELLRELKKDNPEIEDRIFQSTHRVNLETVIGYKKGERTVSFLDGY